MRFQPIPWYKVSLWVAMAVSIVLVGCAQAPPTPMVASPAVTVASPAVTVPTATVAPPTATELPPPTMLPTVAAARPTATAFASATAFEASSSPSRLPHLSATPAGTATPTATATPRPTPRPTFTPKTKATATTTPTRQPSAQLATALRYQTNGEYGSAIVAYREVLADDPTPAQAREARYHLAETLLLNREYLASAAAWEEFLAEYPGDDRRPAATLMLARALDAAGECLSAVPYYQRYLSQEVILADVVYEWIGDCHAAQGNLDDAVAAYRQALDATRDAGLRVSLHEKIAGVHLFQEKYDAAVEEYDAILRVAKIDYYRAKIEYLAGQALAAAGETEAAQARYRRAVERYPTAESAYLALIELVDAGLEVDEFQRGLVDYYAGQTYPDAYGAAIRAFDRYLAGESAPKADEALYRKALAQRATEEPAAALETLETLINGYPQSKWLVKAWLEKGTTLAGMGASDAAVKVFQDLAAFFPEAELAPQALLKAARLREREGAFAQAAQFFESTQANFPAFEDADEALWRAGLGHYRAGDRERAADDWQALLDKYPKSPYWPKSAYWLGKLEVESGAEGQSDYWDQLLASNPGSYYALRVQQIRSGEPLTATRLITTAVEAPTWDAERAEDEILGWLLDWAEVPTATTDLALPTSLAQNADLQRGLGLMAVGMRREALDAFDQVRATAWKDPLALAQLALFFHDQGFHGLAARAALRMAGLWRGGTIDAAPQTVRRLAYPLVYAGLLSAEAQAHKLDPLLLAALIRQESLFEPAAESYAGARGLGQVMPATGEGIARNLGLEDFVLDDLYRPAISVEFGAYYLAVQMRRFDDQLLIALAAYNGGPGNALHWLEAGGDDLDLFVEAITATQSRLYLQKIYQQYLIYEEMYRTSGDKGP